MSTERKPIDWTKPIETVDGRPARLLIKRYVPCNYPYFVIVDEGTPSEEIETTTENGRATVGGAYFIRNVPERRVRRVINMHKDEAFMWLDRWQADREAHPDRKAVVTIYECDGRYEAEVEHV